MQTWEPDPKPTEQKSLYDLVYEQPVALLCPSTQKNCPNNNKLQQLESLYPNQSRRTLQRDLKTLVDLGWLASSGEANQRTYRPTDLRKGVDDNANLER
jgi:hypothetical protein